MAYATGVSSTTANLMAAVAAFATSLGWTQGTSFTIDTAGETAYTLVDPTGRMFTFLAGTNYIKMNIATSIVAGSKMNAQPGSYAARNFTVTQLVAPFTSYHLFSEGANIHVAIELVPNVFAHMNFGSIIKNGTWSGGQYVTGTHTDTSYLNYRPTYGPTSTDHYHGTPFRSRANIGYAEDPSRQGFMSSNLGGKTFSDFSCSNATYNNAVVCCLATDPDSPLFCTNGPNQFNNRAAMFPVVLTHTAAPQLGGPMYQIGYVPNCCFLRIDDIAAKAVVNTDWMVFPICDKNGSGTRYLNTQNYGIAYRK